MACTIPIRCVAVLGTSVMQDSITGNQAAVRRSHGVCSSAGRRRRLFLAGRTLPATLPGDARSITDALRISRSVMSRLYYLAEPSEYPMLPHHSGRVLGDPERAKTRRMGASDMSMQKSFSRSFKFSTYARFFLERKSTLNRATMSIKASTLREDFLADTRV
jgi:hypothetical protein